jgi:hypothetical protein
MRIGLNIVRRKQQAVCTLATAHHPFECTSLDRAKHVTLKLQRAQEHIEELGREVASFYATCPYRVAHRRDPVSKRLTYYVASVTAVPEHLALIAGDVIQNLMSALDHLAFQLVCADTSDQPPNPRWIYFPIADTQRDYDEKKAGKMNGASSETMSAIDALAPFRNGSTALWKLYRLNNIDKHRLLLTAGSQAAGIHLGQMMAPLLKGTFPFPPEVVNAFTAMNQFVMPANRGFPLTAGDELYHTAPDEQPNESLPFRFAVALNEPGVVEGEHLLTTMADLSQAVKQAVDSLPTRLK